MPNELSAKSKCLIDLHDRLREIGWHRCDLTVDKTQQFFGFQFHHPRHKEFGVKAGLCDDYGRVRIELADTTVAEWTMLDNPHWVEDCITNIAASEAEIEMYLKEAGVDDIDDLPLGPDENDIDDELDELL